MKRHNWYRLIAAFLVFVPNSWRPADVSRVETAILIVGLWIMAEISELRETE